MNTSLRQIRDIQAQAERICTGRVSLSEVEAFAHYSKELKSYLENNVEDDFVMKLVSDIPDHMSEMEKKNLRFDLLGGAIAVLGAATPLLSRESRKVDRAKPIVREIQGKYASIGFVLKKAD